MLFNRKLQGIDELSTEMFDSIKAFEVVYISVVGRSIKGA
jgi:hypothetical protein